MRLIKPEWVNHGGKPIFSVDIHPDGQKFATGGQGEDSGKVVIWDLRPVRREEDEKNESIPKLLCQMDNHLACVNCVRWSNSGKLLASGGDDKLVMIWRPVTFIGPSPSPSTMFGSGGNVANVEQWRCASVLRYHSGDVMDVAWSPHDAWLATGSIDNSVVIWNACKFPEVIATLRGHSGLVKGVTWDPVGKYVASQADDKSLKVWSTLDWRLEASITEPFRECGGTTQVLRLGWSPDGHYIVSAHAMNNSGPTAQIVEREGWRSSMDFVGHRKAVTVVRFNPKIFQWKLHNGGADKPGFPYSCCAIGSKDRSLSVWLTCLKRPLVVVHDLFDKSIMDISWNVSGFEMLVCSMDGSVAFAEFSLEELGNPLSQEEKNAIHQKTYGKSLSISSEATIGSTVIESPAMLHLQQQQWGAEERPAILREGPAAEERLEGTGEMGTPGEPMVSVMPYRTVLNGESLEQIRKNLLKNQKETRTPDGRRRITPLCIAQLDISEYQSSAFSSVPLASSVSQFALFSSNPPSPVPDGDAEGSNPIVTQQEPDKHSPEREALPSPIPMSPSKLEPMRALDSRFTERPKVPASPSPVTPTTTTQQQSSVTNVTVNAGPAAVAEKSTRETATPLVEGVSTVTPSVVGGRVESAAASLVVSVRPQRESSSDSDDRAAVGVKGHVPPPVPRKKTEGEDGSALKKKGRPRKDPKIVATGLVIQASTHVEKDPSRLSATTTPTLKLPVIVAQKSFSLQVSSEPGLSLEVENETGGVGNLKLHRLVCRREGAGSWDTHLTSRVLAAAASSEAVAVACEDRTLIAFSSCGRRLLPPLILPALPSSLQLNQHFVLLLTILGTLHVWDLRSNRAVIDGQSLSPIVSGSEVSVTRIVVTNQGMPLVTLNSGRSYSYSTSLAAWMQVCDPQNPLTLVSDLQSNLPTQHALHCSGPLASLQSQGGSSGRQASRLASLGPKLRGAATLIHLEGQVAAALALHSPSEYRFWLLSYARYLTHEGLESRLRELCTELLGPVPVSSSSQWDPYVLGLSRRGLLREVLPLLGTNLKLQRLFSELQEQLEAAATD